MALRTPPSWLQYGSHTAENDRLTNQAIYSTTGVIGNSMQVTAQGSPNMTVNAGTGWCSIVSSTSNAGVYVGYNDAPVILTITTSDATNPRIDLIVATVNDQAYSGVTNNITYQVIAGTPAGSPAVPSTPSNSIALAQIAVAAGATSITSANITDVRVATFSNMANAGTQLVHLSANGSALGASGNVFGATNRPLLTAGRSYEITIQLPFTKTTTGTVTWRLTSSTTNGFSFGAMNVADSVTANVATVTNTAASFLGSVVTGSYTTATNYYSTITATVTAALDTRLSLFVAGISAGTVTPLAGANMIVTDLGSANTLGNIG